jgi:hypothetical protein
MKPSALELIINFRTLGEWGGEGMGDFWNSIGNVNEENT